METLTGAEITRIMRAHHITIRQAAALFDITLTRVRHVRAHGVEGAIFVWEWSSWLPQAAWVHRALCQ